MYKKIDSPMHPEFHPEKLKELQLQKEEPKSTFRKFFSNIKSKFTEWIFGENDTPIPCVHIYLAEYFELLTGKVYSDIDPCTVLNNVVVIYESLHRCYFHYDSNSRMVHIKSVKEVSKCFSCSEILTHRRRNRGSPPCYLPPLLFLAATFVEN